MRTHTVVQCFVVLFALTPAISPADTNPPLISVTGQAHIKVVPDEIVVTLGVSNRDLSLDKAKLENDARTRKILALAGEFKIDSKHVQTSYLSIEPEYKDTYSEDNPGKFLGYSVDKTIVFILKKASDLESLVSKALAAGANKIESIEFGTTELRKHRDKARLLAIRAAKEKALLLAEELEMTIGKPHLIQEGDANEWGGLSGGLGNVVLFVADYEDDEPSSRTTFALGQIEIIARIHVSFELVSKPPKDPAR